MPQHEVTFEAPPRMLRRADVKFVVKSDGYVLGTLAISNGSLVWWPKKTTNGYKVDWAKFHQLMEEHATRVEVR